MMSLIGGFVWIFFHCDGDMVGALVAWATIKNVQKLNNSIRFRHGNLHLKKLVGMFAFDIKH